MNNKTYVKQGNKATIVCPECNSAKTISVEMFKNKLHNIKVKCSCGHTFAVELEFRKSFRKTTSLPGKYNLHSSTGNLSGSATITDLSLTGVSLKTNHHQKIKPGVKGQLVLTLDDRKQSTLVRQVVVRRVKEDNIGCEFCDDMPSKELGFYMLAG